MISQIFNIVVIALCYLLGAFPTGKLVSKMHGIEIEKVGSGNVGATNLARSIGKKAGLITLGGDVLKGFLAVFLGNAYGGMFGIFPGTMLSWSVVAVVMGHCFSLPGMRGGKGVATALGAILFLSPLIALGSLVIFSIAFWKTRYVSAASITACILAPIAGFILYPESDWPVALGISALTVTYRHKDNIKRLIEGSESKFEFAKK